jgi:hypothetical protein
MRNKLFSIVAGLALVSLSASSALADTTGGGGAELGLDAVQISGGTVISKTGEVTLTGSISCSQDVEAYVSAELTQVVGRFHTISGWGGTLNPVTCLAANGTAGFSFSFFPYEGKFAAGTARVTAMAQAGFCDEVACSIDEASYGPASLRLKGGRG